MIQDRINELTAAPEEEEAPVRADPTEHVVPAENEQEAEVHRLFDGLR